jgi:MutS-like protein
MTHAVHDRRFHQLGNARLATGLAGVLIAALSIGASLLSPWWLVAPVAVFVILAIIHDRVDRTRLTALRAMAYYERALGRVENSWIGQGRKGEEYRDPKHIYADDLDVFGAGSIFELLSTSRTSAGERVLAGWLSAPGDLAAVQARQQAVAELAPRLDLREEIALMGEDMRAAIDDRATAHWGQLPLVRFFPGARWVAFALACAAVATFVLWLAQVLTLRPFLFAILAEMIFGFAMRDSTRSVAASVDTPSLELKLLGLLLARLEREEFTSPHLLQLTHSLDAHGLTPSAEIARLERLVDHMDSARNQFFRAIAAPLLWIPQFAMAIEAWRQDCGPHIGEWIAAVGEFEALCSLACFAHERPQAVFPEFVADSDKAGVLFAGEGVRHPLIDPAYAVPNDVTLTSACPLWVVSGSNMSGKSTLLRAVGLNTVLAWAGAPVCCDRLRVSPLRIGASIRVNDSLADNRSRFYAEISRLREVMDLARSGLPTLFLLDELLSGTNSHDRRIGAAALVRGLVERGAIGLVTTHDLALADIAQSLAERARNVHLEDHMEGGEMRFDYRLRPGVVERSNALELMRAVGLDV